MITLEPVQNLSTHVWLASFPPYFAKILVNTQSIACDFGFIWRKIWLRHPHTRRF